MVGISPMIWVRENFFFFSPNWIPPEEMRFAIFRTSYKINMIPVFQIKKKLSDKGRKKSSAFFDSGIIQGRSQSEYKERFSIAERSENQIK